MIKKTLYFYVIYLLIGISALIPSSCSLFQRQYSSMAPDKIPLDEFILGNWVSEKAITYEKKENSYKFKLIVEDGKILRFIWFSSDGVFLDGTTSNYKFLNTNTIFIDNKRIIGGEIWVLERDGQKLIINRTINNKDDLIIFSREIK